VCGQREAARQKGGDHAAAVGPNPTDRGRPGTKRHLITDLITDRQGTPLAVCLTGANRQDSMVFELLLDLVPGIRTPSGRRRQRPHKLHADKAYDHPTCRLVLRQRHIVSRIARRGIESSARLGRHRWVVERTFAWLNQFRRLAIRYERRRDIHQAFTVLGGALICWTTLTRPNT
jgi:transposase